MRRFATAGAVCVSLCFTGVAWAAPSDTVINATQSEGASLTIPRGSPVELVEELTERPQDQFGFTGDFTVSGTFTAGYVHSDSADDIVWHFVFAPDEATVRNLPRWSSGIDDIGFTNEEEFLKAAVPAATLAALHKARKGTVSGRVTVRASGWDTSYACDQSSYGTRYVSMAAKPRLIAAQPLRDPGDC